MKNNVTLMIAIGALALSLVSWASRDTRTEAPTSAPRSDASRLTAAPRVEGAHGTCQGSEDARTLKGLMRSGVNTAMTGLSFALFHAPGQSQERMAKTAQEASRLLGCIQSAAVPPPEVGLAGLPDYFRFLSSLQENALAINVAAMEGDEESARHWFRHLKQDCVSCHSRFRVEPAAASMEPATKAP